jgi:hypothetical protein
MPIARRLEHTNKTRWRGWYRARGDCWRVLCEADDYGAAWATLLQRLPAKNGDAIVMASDRVP